MKTLNHNAKHNILLIDDESSVLKLMERFLSNPGYEIFSCENAKDALSIMQEHHFDVVVSDHMMPEMTGVEFFQQIKTLHPYAVRILITGRAEYDEVIDAVNAGEIYRIFIKPMDAKAFRSTIADVIENLETKQDLKRTQDMLLAIAKAAPDGVIMLDDDGKVCFWNDSAQKIFGFSTQEIIGETFLEKIIPKGTSPFSFQKPDEISDVNKKKFFEKSMTYKANHRDGHSFYIELTSDVVLLDNQWQTIAIVRDITYKQKLEKQLKNSEKRFRTLVESQRDAIIVTDPQGYVLFVNLAAEAMWARKKDRFIGQYLDLQMIAGQSTEIEISVKNGDIIIGDMRTYEIQWDDNDALLSSVRDITKQRKLHEKLVESHANLSKTVKELKNANEKIVSQQKAVIEQEKLKLLLQITGSTIHEIDQPLKVLLASINSLKLETKDSDKLKDRIRQIEEAALEIKNTFNKIDPLKKDSKESLIEVPNIAGKKHLHILYIEDEDAGFFLMESFLEENKNITLFHAKTLFQADTMLKKEKFDIVMLDYMLPDGNGLDYLLKLKKNGIDIPVIIVTGQGDEVIASKLIQAGAYNYLPKKDMDTDSLHRVIVKAIEQYRLNTDLKKVNSKMAEMAYKDGLTGLYNRRYLTEALEREIDGAQRYKQELSICIFDLDHFKTVNDTYGHLCGDIVLKIFGKLLLSNKRKTDTPCRYGGEEMAVILPGISLSQATNYAQRIRKDLEKYSFCHEDHYFSITVSAGVASLNDLENVSAENLIEICDQALYKAKTEGRNQVFSFIAES